MRCSKLLSKTSKQAPKDADSVNAKFLLQGGFIHQTLAGAYSFLPLGLKVLQKIANIAREEMNAIDSQEILMSSLLPIENLRKTGRDKVDVLYQPTEHVGLGFSHEEVVTPIVKSFLASYKDMPLSVYQVQTKFRNEARAKSGILRGREFTMKDMYSFHTSQEDLNHYYDRTKEAYMNVYRRCGLTAYMIEASGGIFAKEPSHEFVVQTEAGEDIMLYCPKCYMAQNLEVAVARLLDDPSTEALLPLTHVDGIHGPTVELQAKHYGVPAAKILKTIVYFDLEGQSIAVCIRGDLEINEEKLQKTLGIDLRPATEEELQARGLVRGFISPIGQSFDRIIGDVSLHTMKNYITGANAFQKDLLNANPGRDFVIDQEIDCFTATVAMGCAQCDGILEASKVAEVGNIFKLGTKYSEAFDLTFTDEHGTIHPVIMGCYGIGVSRLVGTIVEACHDERGIIWPKSVAPYQFHLVTLGTDPAVIQEAEALYAQLIKHKVEVLYDDRDVSAGNKLVDADLIGIPHRILISNKTLASSDIEWKNRDETEAKKIPLNEVLMEILHAVS